MSRQKAKERQQDEALMSLKYLWAEEWAKIHPEDQKSGFHLSKRLWTLERVGSNYLRLRPAFVRSAEVSEPKFNDDDELQVKPRRSVFPEDDWKETLDDETPSWTNSIQMWTCCKDNEDDKDFDDPDREYFYSFLPFSRDIHLQSKLNLEVPVLKMLKCDPIYKPKPYGTERMEPRARNFQFEESTTEGHQEHAFDEAFEGNLAFAIFFFFLEQIQLNWINEGA